MNAAVKHHYRHFRAHQQKVWADGGGMLTTYPTGRTEVSYASAPYGEHALSAWTSARRHAHFMADLGKRVADSKKRSKAAKKAWATRRAAPPPPRGRDRRWK